jgi:hypothetical protein
VVVRRLLMDMDVDTKLGACTIQTRLAYPATGDMRRPVLSWPCLATGADVSEMHTRCLGRAAAPRRERGAAGVPFRGSFTESP